MLTFLSSSPLHTSLFHPPFIGTNLMLINCTASSNCQQAEQNSMYTCLMLQQKERLPLPFYLFSGRTLDVSHLLYSKASLSQLVAASFLSWCLFLSHPKSNPPGDSVVLHSKKVQTLSMSHYLRCYCKSSLCHRYLNGCRDQPQVCPCLPRLLST